MLRATCRVLSQSMPSGKIDFGRMRVEVADRSALMQKLADEQRDFFENNTPDYFRQESPTPQGVSEQIRAFFSKLTLKQHQQRIDYGTRMGITIMNHINNQDWAMLFGIREMYMEVTCWLWIVHLWLVQKRMIPLPDSSTINKYSMRLFQSMTQQRYHDIYDTSIEARRAVGWVAEQWNANISALDEAFHADCEYRDAILLYALYRNSPFEHREEVPFYAWHTMVQYIRLHLAVWDRIPNAEFRQGRFFFYHPMDENLFDRPPTLDEDNYVRDILRGKRGAKVVVPK